MMTDSHLDKTSRPVPETVHETQSSVSGSSGSGFFARIRGLFQRSSEKDLRESLEEVFEAKTTAHSGEGLNSQERSMILNLIEFGDLRVDDVMVPRADIVAVEESAPMSELLAYFMTANHSRLPVYRSTLDDIVGMVHVKDFLRWMLLKACGRKKIKIDKPLIEAMTIPAHALSQTIKQSGIYREVLFVPPSMPASDLLVKMQASHIHIAIIIDEYGGTDGLASIEDLMEMIVGDISDEHDKDDGRAFVQQAENIYLADARVELKELETLLKVVLLPEEEEGEADSLGGLACEMAGRVPVRGEILKHGSGLEFEILDGDPRRVKRLRIYDRRQRLIAVDKNNGERDQLC